jgi:lipoprotein NlpI
MMMKCLTVVFAFGMLVLAGCQNKQAKAQDDLKKLEAEYAPLQAQYNKDCLSGSPEHIAANRSLCEDERKKTADLDQRIAILQQQAMQ